MASGCDEVEHGVDTVVPEARVTLDTRLLCENVVILPLKEADDLRETGMYRISGATSTDSSEQGIAPGLIVDLITKTRSVHDGQRDTSSLLIKLELYPSSQKMHYFKVEWLSAVRTNGVGLDLDSILDVGASRVVGFLVAENAFSAKSVDEGSSACVDANKTSAMAGST